MKARITTLVATSVLLLLAGSAQAETTYDFSFGSSGTGPGQFSDPRGVAINDTTGHVYVVDRALHRVSQFDAFGNFIRMWGAGVNQDTGGDVCTAVSGDVCQSGTTGEAAGTFNNPQGIQVDNSGGPATGSVYVQDTANNRIQRFSADGELVLMWGKGVNQTTGGNICTASSGDVCKAGATSGDPNTTPPTPSEKGVFAGWRANEQNPHLGIDEDGFVYVGSENAVPYGRVQKFDSTGAFVSQVAGFERGGSDPGGAVASDRGIEGLDGLTANASGDAYVINSEHGHPILTRYRAIEFTSDGLSARWDLAFGVGISTSGGAGPQVVATDPHNQYIFAGSNEPRCENTDGPNGYQIAEYHPLGQLVDCTVPTGPPIGSAGGIAVSASHKLYLTDVTQETVHVFDTPVATLPSVGGQTVGEITSSKAVIEAEVSANLDETTVRIEYGTTPCSGSVCASTAESESIGAAVAPEPIRESVTSLTPNTTYFYRVVATNDVGSTAGPDRSFTTFPQPQFDPSCSNNLARQQTGAAFLLDCRAYELVSAEDQGGYNVASDLVAGQEPYGGFPQASDRALYAIHNGAVPNTGKPTNRGPDPYVATRDAENERWVTEYVGVPADAPSFAPFSSTVAGADSSLSSFAFGGPELCDPCLGDGTSGIPLRRPDGSLVQGMAGPLAVADPEAFGDPLLSPDGTNLIFASKQAFVNGAHDNGTEVTVYNRDLEAGTTRIASRLPSTQLIQADEDVVALDVSADGNRTLIGELLSTDAEGNRYFHLYMHVGSAINTIDITPGTTTGALYAGMNDAGTRIYFTTKDPLVGDSDASADLYRSVVGSSSAVLSRASTGTGGTGNTDACDPAANSYNTEDWNTIEGGPTDCSVVAISGQGGVSSADGTAYFLSPEALDGHGTDGAPNLFRVSPIPGQSPVFVETLESSENEPLKPEAHLFQRSYGSFSYPEGVAIDADDGSTYVLDTIATSGRDEEGNPVGTPGAFVQKFDAQGNPDLTFGNNSKLFGSPSGPFLAIGQGYPFSPTGRPTQVAVDNSGSASDGSLYVPDNGNSIVYKFNSSGLQTGQLTLGIGFPPTGIAVNQTNGRVYATSDLSSEVYVFGPNGFPVAPGSFPITGFPVGVAVDSGGNVYVANEADTRVYNSSGAFVEVLDPNPSFGVAVDPTDDHVYVNRGDRVVKYDETGTEVATIGLGRLGDSVSLAAHGGRLEISNPSRGRVASYSAPTTPPDSGYDNPMVLNGARDAETRHTADFQTTPDGNYAAFPSAMPLTGFDNAGRYEVFRHDAVGGQTDCLSCNPTDLPPTTDASLATDGLSITDDGRVFFNTGEALVLRDANSRRDVYEWSEVGDAGDGRAELISSGRDSFDSSLLTVSADGVDAFFFTRERLASNDQNGTLMRIYTAREDGGFFKIPPEPPCAASDECHGPGSEPAPPIDLGTLEGSGGNAPQPESKQNNRCDTRKLARRARGFSKRAKALRRKAVRGSNRRAKRRMRLRARRFAQGARKNATAAKRCRARTKARRAAR